MTNDLDVLYLEDDLNDIDTFNSTIKKYNVENQQKKVTVRVCKTLEELQNVLSDRNNVFDGIIIDIKLNNEFGKGNETTDIVELLLLRVPCIAYTGTPDDVYSELILKKFTKGASSIEEVLDYLYDIKQTGLMELLGNKGILEKYLSKIYAQSIKSNITNWIECGKKKPAIVANSMLRHVAYCITELIDKDYENSLAAEAYISPNISKSITTGTILRENDTQDLYIILSPECDLVIRKDTQKPKTDCVLLCKIDSLKKHEKIKNISNSSNTNFNKIKAFTSNSSGNFYHFLPKTNLFDDSLVNFRKVKNIPYEEIDAHFTNLCKTAYPYTKDILSRFSTYYSRQGQPDFYFDDIVTEIMNELINSNVQSNGSS